MKVSSTWNWVFQALGTGCSGLWNWVFRALELGVPGFETGCFRLWNWVFQALKFSGREAGEFFKHTMSGRTAFPSPECRKIFRKPFLFGYNKFCAGHNAPSVLHAAGAIATLFSPCGGHNGRFVCHAVAKTVPPSRGTSPEGAEGGSRLLEQPRAHPRTT